LSAAGSSGAGLTKEAGTQHEQGDREKFEKVAKGTRSADEEEQGTERRVHFRHAQPLESKDYDTAIASLTKASELDPEAVSACWGATSGAGVRRMRQRRRPGPEFDAL